MLYNIAKECLLEAEETKYKFDESLSDYRQTVYAQRLSIALGLVMGLFKSSVDDDKKEDAEKTCELISKYVNKGVLENE